MAEAMPFRFSAIVLGEGFTHLGDDGLSPRWVRILFLLR